MREAHQQQLDILRTAIAEERREALQAQHVIVFEKCPF
jgi:hypothetical protein